MIKETNYLPTIGLGLKCKHKHSLKYKSDLDENCTLDDCCDIFSPLSALLKKRYHINNICAAEFNRIISHAVVRKPIKYMCRGDPKQSLKKKANFK